MKMNVRTLVINGVLAALYIAVTALIMPFGFTAIQFRVSEIFNHLIVFDKKYFWGIIVGVFLANLFMSTLGPYEFLGLAQTIISLSITMAFGTIIKSKLILMGINTLVFTFNMYIVAYMLKLAVGAPFLITWVTSAIGEFTVMSVGISIIYALHRRLKFDQIMS